MALGVNEAAERMGVSPIRVRQLIREGRLEAQKIGRQWVIDEAALAGKVRIKSPGRPMSPKNALALAQKLEGKRISGLSSVEMQRIHRQVGNLLAHGDPKRQLQSWLAARAEPREFVVSNADISDMREDPRIHLSGVSDPRSGLLPGNEVEAYIAKEFLRALEREWFLVPASRGRKANVILRVIDELPSEVPAIFSAIDLAEHSGPREQAASDSIIRGILNGN